MIWTLKHTRGASQVERESIIETLGLLPHDEGGWFRETYVSSWTTKQPDRPGIRRSGLTCIYYMLTSDQPCGWLHRNRSDIHHFFQAGSPLRYVIVSPEGKLSVRLLGSDFTHGEMLQMTVPGGWWKATELVEGDFGLVGEAVTPGFDYRDRQLATKSEIQRLLPHLWNKLRIYLAPEAAS